MHASQPRARARPNTSSIRFSPSGHYLPDLSTQSQVQTGRHSPWAPESEIIQIRQCSARSPASPRLSETAVGFPPAPLSRPPSVSLLTGGVPLPGDQRVTIFSMTMMSQPVGLSEPLEHNAFRETWSVWTKSRFPP